MTRRRSLHRWLVLCLGLCGLLGPMPLPAAPAGTPAAAPYRITMLLFRGCEEACRGFQSYLRQQGVAFELTLRDAAQDRGKVAGFVQEIRSTRPDLVITWGTTVTLETVGRLGEVDPARHLTDIPVVFMIVSNPVADGVVADLARPRRNVTGTLYLLPLRTQLDAARSYMPFRQVGFLLNPNESNSVSTLTELAELAPQLGLQLHVRTLGNLAGEDRGMRAFMDEFKAAGVELLYFGPDTFLNSRRELLTDTALQLGLPVFAAAEAPVRQARALFGVVNRYEDVGRFTAAQALRVLRDGDRPQDVPVELPRNFSYLVNLPAALQLRRYPPLRLLDVAEIVGLDPAR